MLGMIPGGLLMSTGNTYAVVAGAVMVGPGMLSILLCCVVIGLADIRTLLTAILKVSVIEENTRTASSSKAFAAKV